jgi:peptidoglycan LD-endopeptidase CwlK
VLNSRDLRDLDPHFAQLVYRWLAACDSVDIEILIVSTYRDNEYQDYLYSLGRTQLGKVCTNARGGQSKHNKRLAVDFCIMNGKTCDWTNTASFSKAGQIAESIGLVWAGRWSGKLREIGHIEL